MNVRTKSIVAQITAKNLHDFLRPFKKVLSRPKQKHLLTAIKGMIAGSTVVLSQIGRETEPDIMPKTYCEKLGKSLEEFSKLSNIQLGKARNVNLELIILDGGDIQRLYTNKIDAITKVRDGSTCNNNGRGYGLHAAIGMTEQGKYIPLVLERYDEQKPAEHNIVTNIISQLSPHHGAVWVLDRGYDDKKFFHLLLDNDQEFLVRLTRKAGQRCLQVEDETFLVSELLAHFENEKVGYRRVKLPNRDEVLTLIHYQHNKYREPLALLTTLSPKTQKQAINIAKKYLKRWKIEDYFRFIKQRFALENIMLHQPKRVDGLLTLVLIASALIMRLEQKPRDIVLDLEYNHWLKKNQLSSSWSAFAKFMQEILPFWQITFRTANPPPNPLQLALCWP